MLVFGRCGKKENLFSRARARFLPKKTQQPPGCVQAFFVADFVLFACLLWWPAGPTVVLLAPHDAFFFLDFVHVAAWFFWCRVFTSLTPLVFGAGSCTYGSKLMSRSLFCCGCSAARAKRAAAAAPANRGPRVPPRQPCTPSPALPESQTPSQESQTPSHALPARSFSL